jgi:hypothetical protein
VFEVNNELADRSPGGKRREPFYGTAFGHLWLAQISLLNEKCPPRYKSIATVLTMFLNHQTGEAWPTRETTEPLCGYVKRTIDRAYNYFEKTGDLRRSEAKFNPTTAKSPPTRCTLVIRWDELAKLDWTSLPRGTVAFVHSLWTKVTEDLLIGKEDAAPAPLSSAIAECYAGARLLEDPERCCALVGQALKVDRLDPLLVLDCVQDVLSEGGNADDLAHALWHWANT